MPDIAGAGRKVLDGGFGASETDDLLGKREDGLALAVADVVSARHILRVTCIGERSDDIGHVDKVSRLAAVAMDANWFIAESLGDEDGHGGGVGGARVLSWAKDVKEA